MNNTSELYDRLAGRMVGGVVFVFVLMVIGFLGNVHILFVYTFRKKSSNHRIFILFLGLLDILACCIAMPYTVITLLQPEMFTKNPTCKLYWFVNYFMCSASGLALLVIAVERYRKICVPLGWQLTRRTAVMSCVVVLFVTALSSWPVLILMGTTTVPTQTPRITDSICATEDKENYNTYQMYYHGVLSLVVLPCFVALIVMYILIWRVVRKYAVLKQGSSKFYIKDDSTSMNSLINSVRKASTKSRNDDVNQHHIIRPDSKKSLQSGSAESNQDCDNSQKSGNNRRSDRTKKTTLAFILITVIFFISYIPYLVITFLIYSENMTYLTPAEVVFINIIRYTPYINNVANVFVYGCFDVHFRCEVRKLYMYVYKSCWG